MLNANIVKGWSQRKKGEIREWLLLEFLIPMLNVDFTATLRSHVFFSLFFCAFSLVQILFSRYPVTLCSNASNDFCWRSTVIMLIEHTVMNNFPTTTIRLFTHRRRFSDGLSIVPIFSKRTQIESNLYMYYGDGFWGTHLIRAQLVMLDT